MGGKECSQSNYEERTPLNERLSASALIPQGWPCWRASIPMVVARTSLVWTTIWDLSFTYPEYTCKLEQARVLDLLFTCSKCTGRLEQPVMSNWPCLLKMGDKYITFNEWHFQFNIEVFGELFLWDSLFTVIMQNKAFIYPCSMWLCKIFKEPTR